MPIIAETWVLVGNEDEARKCAPLWHFMPKALDAFTSDPDRRAIQRRAEQEIPLEQVYSSWIIGEDPEVHIEGLKKLFDAGVTSVIVHSAQADQERVIDFYGKSVLPKSDGIATETRLSCLTEKGVSLNDSLVARKS